MNKNAIMIYGSLIGSAVIGGTIAWVSMAPWWAIILSAVASPLLLIFCFFIAIVNELGKHI